MRLAALACVLLAACATVPPTPLPVGEIRTVPVPTPVPCVHVTEIPPLPAPPPLPPDADAEQRAAWVGLRMLQWHAYAVTLRTLLLRCSSS